MSSSSTPTIPHDMIGRHMMEIDEHDDVDWYQLWPQVDSSGTIVAIVDASDIDALGLVGVWWSDLAGELRLGDQNEGDCDVYARREEVQS